ncbi:MAG: sigma 54-interacting transcriptional regulator [Planctomycetota bacterium]|nr:sigma 54-interacting transcriptional regulator [Planctomycetota bacterium]
MTYLVTREGDKWTDVYRLVPGETTTIGRTPTNRIVIKDERCSRRHAEVFNTESGWVYRDLDSRNGSFLGTDRLEQDARLEIGDAVRIGAVYLQLVEDVADVFSDGSSIIHKDALVAQTKETGSDPNVQVLTESEERQITHRTKETQFLTEKNLPDDSVAINQVGQAATALLRLACDLAEANNLSQLCELTLTGLCEETNVEAGAVLLLPPDLQDQHPTAADLEIFTTKTTTDEVYHRCTDFLATTVLQSGEAIMAQNAIEDSQLGGRDSKGDIHATSVIVAPICGHEQVLGALHLYSTRLDMTPDPLDLEFTLAVAKPVGVALENLRQRDALADDLNLVQAQTVELIKLLGAESEIVGASTAIEKVNQEIVRAAPSRSTVLIRGESGVGKELVARAVHYASPRSEGPFVCLNCAALTETLLESELFGHEKGAFTGATTRKRGKFEAADGGTLMLDEIGEMSPTIQAKFLRVLEGHAFERVGGSEPIRADVRVIAATNRDLEKDVEEKLFRRDLYFRLHVIEILVPPLRKRPDDIPLLAEHFLQKYNQETGRRIRGFTHEALDALVHYRWPGNVRELKNVIERAVVLTQGEYLEVDDLTLSNLGTVGDSVTGMMVKEQQYEPRSLADMERVHIEATLNATDWNKSRTASILGIERSTLDRKIKRYELKQ